MRPFPLSCLLLMAFVLSATSQDSKPKVDDPRPDRAQLTKLVRQLVISRSTDKEALKELDSGCARALVQGNIEVLQMIEADEFTFTSPEGTILTKAQDLQTITSGDLVYDKLYLDDVNVRLFGDTGVVTGRANVKGRYKTFDISGAYRYTVTFVRLQGRWQAVASQMTRVMS